MFALNVRRSRRKKKTKLKHLSHRLRVDGCSRKRQNRNSSTLYPRTRQRQHEDGLIITYRVAALRGGVAAVPEQSEKRNLAALPRRLVISNSAEQPKCVFGSSSGRPLEENINLQQQQQQQQPERPVERGLNRAIKTPFKIKLLETKKPALDASAGRR